jgi:hypothetical protein
MLSEKVRARMDVDVADADIEGIHFCVGGVDGQSGKRSPNSISKGRSAFVRASPSPLRDRVLDREVDRERAVAFAVAEGIDLTGRTRVRWWAPVIGATRSDGVTKRSSSCCCDRVASREVAVLTLDDLDCRAGS